MLELKVTKIIPQPNDNVLMQLLPLNGEKVAFKAGQFISLLFHQNGKEIRRSYSLMNAPNLNEPLMIGVKLVENGAISQHLHFRIREGDIVTANYPQGQCVYEPIQDTKRTVFLFAAGIGITPLFSILKTALTGEQQSKIILIYSNGSAERTPILNDLKYWQSQYPNRFEIIWIFSNSKNLLKAHLNRDYILDILEKHAPTTKSDCLFYTCGPIIYMDLCRFILLARGYEEAQIKKETFLLPEDEADEDDDTEKNIDKTTYRVHIDFQGNTYQFEIPYNKTILDVALENKIALPYSCRSGMCSTCISDCTAGAVRMDYNEVLTDKEMANGKILLCTGHPTQNDTKIIVP